MYLLGRRCLPLSVLSHNDFPLKALLDLLVIAIFACAAPRKALRRVSKTMAAEVRVVAPPCLCPREAAQAQGALRLALQAPPGALPHHRSRLYATL